LRKAIINFVMSVRPSVHMEQLGSPHCMDFYEMWYSVFFGDQPRKFKFR